MNYSNVKSTVSVLFRQLYKVFDVKCKNVYSPADALHRGTDKYMQFSIL